MKPLSLWDSLNPVQQGEAMASATVLVFALTYVGMALGRIPGLRVDRSGIAMLAAVVLVAMGAIPADQIVQAIHFPTLLLMGRLMILSARFRAAGFYDAAATWIAGQAGQPLRLLALTILISGVFSALLINDIVVFAMTPILCTGLAARKLDPRPFLFGLAAGSNAGSAATLIGNPQNILIGQVGRLDFWNYLAMAIAPASIAMMIAFACIAIGSSGWLPDRISLLIPTTLLLSNTIGNVPAVVMLLTVWPDIPSGVLIGLAVLTTLAGNFVLVGSLANLIVAKRALIAGVKLSFYEHAKTGVPITILSMLSAGLWLWIAKLMPL